MFPLHTSYVSKITLYPLHIYKYNKYQTFIHVHSKIVGSIVNAFIVTKVIARL